MRGASIVWVAVLLSATAFAQTSVGTAFTYQGQLTRGGQLLTDTADLQFTLWDAATTPPGSQIGAAVYSYNVSVADGLFTTTIDFGSNVFQGDARWLEIAVRSPAGGGTYTTLSPRQESTVVPYALYALNGPGGGVPNPLTLIGRQEDGYIIGGYNAATSGNSLGLYGSNASPSGFGVLGEGGPGIGVRAVSGGNDAISAATSAPNRSGVFAQNTAAGGTTYGVYALASSTNGRGIFGAATADSGNTYGVHGRSHSASGAGVFGEALGVSGTAYGVRGVTNSSEGCGVYGTGPQRGVWGESSYCGVYGREGEGSGSFLFTPCGIWGDSHVSDGVRGVSYSGAGVAGYATCTSIGNYGVYGSSAGLGGTGVYGEATADSGVTYGIRGVTNSPEGCGVAGVAKNAWANGVWGKSSEGCAGYFESENGWAGRFEGDVMINGNGNVWIYNGAGVVGNLAIAGDLYVNGSKHGYVTDLVKNVGDQPLEPGDLVEIAGAGQPILGEIPVILVRKTRGAASKAVLGPIDCAVNVTEARTPPARPRTDTGDNTAPTPETSGPRLEVHRTDGTITPQQYGQAVTLGAFKMIKVDASSRPIQPGDLLVSSNKPGLAMATDDPKIGTVIGKALGSLGSGTGTIPLLVSPR